MGSIQFSTFVDVSSCAEAKKQRRRQLRQLRSLQWARRKRCKRQMRSRLDPARDHVPRLGKFLVLWEVVWEVVGSVHIASPQFGLLMKQFDCHGTNIPLVTGCHETLPVSFDRLLKMRPLS